MHVQITWYLMKEHTQ